MWRDPHYAALYTNEGWFQRYTQQDGFKELEDASDFQELTKGMLNRAFLSDVWGASPAEIDDAYPFYRDTFSQTVLGRPVTSESDFANGVKDKFDESTSSELEIAARLGRGTMVGINETRAGVNATINSLLRGQRNPYVDKTVQDAVKDVAILKKQIAEGEAYVKDRLKKQPRGFVPPKGSLAAQLPDLRHQLVLAELAAQGKTPENFLGSLSRATADIAEESREDQKWAEGLFDEQISSAHDDQWVMRVADSMGQSAAGTVTSVMNPVLGLSLAYAQTFEASRAEYLASASERGLDTSEEAAERYAHSQALVQTPFELVGDVAIGKAVKAIFKSIPAKMLKSGPETFGHWLGERSKDIARSTAGEVFITTPAQTLAESLLAEGAGVHDATTWGEKGLSILDAMSIAAGQSGAMGGGVTVGAGAIKGVKGDFSGRVPKANTLDQVPADGEKYDPERQDEGVIEFGGEPEGIRFSKGGAAPADIGKMWLNISNDEQTRKLGANSDSKDISEILHALSPEAADKVTILNDAGRYGPGFTFKDGPEDKIYLMKDTDRSFRVDSAEAGRNSTPIYQTIYTWAHNNGYQINEDHEMTPDGVYRRASQMLSSALRHKTTRHMTVGPKSGIENQWIRNDDSPEAIAHNIGLLANLEAEVAIKRLPQLASLRYDMDTHSFYDGEYRIPDAEAEAYIERRVGDVGSGFSERVGPATLRRALATRAAQGSRSNGHIRMVGFDAEAAQSLSRVLYALSSSNENGSSQEVQLRGGEARSVTKTEPRGGLQNKGEGAPSPGGESSPASGGAGSERSRSESELAAKSTNVARVEDLLKGVQKGWGSRLKTKVHASVDDIDNPKLRRGAQEAGNVEAFFDPSDRTIHIIADRVDGAADAERLLRHEGIHWAFDGPMRGEYLDILDATQKLIPEDRWQELKRSYEGHSDRDLVEEYLAYEGQNNPKSTMWKSFAYEVKSLLRKVFGDRVSFTDSDVLALLHKANRKLERANTQADGSGSVLGEEVSFSKQGQGRRSWDEVQVKDDFNAVKKHLPKNADAPQILQHTGPDQAVYAAIASELRARPTATDPDGVVVLVANPENAADRTLERRAEHLSASKDDRYKMGHREFREDKAKWIPNIWKTIEDYGAKILHYKDVGYVRKYKDGTIHIVFIDNGKVVNQVMYDSAVVSQRALDATYGLKGATILKKR